MNTRCPANPTAAAAAAALPDLKKNSPPQTPRRSLYAVEKKKKLQACWFYFIFPFDGRFTLPLARMKEPRDLEACAEFHSKSGRRGGKRTAFPLNPGSNAKHLPATAGG